jgi:hypothetical protein
VGESQLGYEMTLSDAVHRLHGQAASAVIAPRREAAAGCDPRHTTMLSVMLSPLVSVRVTAAYPLAGGRSVLCGRYWRHEEIEVNVQDALDLGDATTTSIRSLCSSGTLGPVGAGVSARPVGDRWNDEFVTDDDLMPRPAAAAWLPGSGDDRAIVRWIAERADDAAYKRRALFVQQTGNLKHLSRAVQAYGGNQNVGSSRNPNVNRGGPVLAYRTDVRLLGHAVAAAEHQVLGVVEHVPGEIAGWAAATNAIDLATGEPTASVPEEIYEALVDLHMAGYNGYSRDREAYFAALYFSPIDVLLTAGYPYAFAASYLVALGAPGDRVGGDLRRIYVSPEKRRKVKH